MRKVLLAQENQKRGPLALAGGVQVHLWDDWLLVVSQQHQFSDKAPGTAELKLWGRAEFEAALEARLKSAEAPRLAPFWVSFSEKQNGRNTLVAAGPDKSWPLLTATQTPVISAFKLLKRWRDANLKLFLSPHW